MGDLHLILPFTLLNGDERHHVATLQIPCCDKVGIGTARCTDIRHMSLFCTDAHSDRWQMPFGNDGCEGRPLLALERSELVKTVQALTRIHKGRCVLTEVLQIDPLELVHTLECIVVVFERMVTDFLQLAVALVDGLEKDPL